MQLAGDIDELHNDGGENIATNIMSARKNGTPVVEYHLEDRAQAIAITTEEGVYANLPSPIKKLRRFVLWRYEEVKGRQTKVPYYAVGHKTMTNNPQTWNTFQGALKILRENQDYFSGLGIVLGDGLTGIDLDKIILKNNTLRSEAARLVAEIPGYVEKSPSGTGLHIIVRGLLPKNRKHSKFTFKDPLCTNSSDLYHKFEFEFYDETSPRYLTLTGNVWEERSVLNDDDASEALAAAFRRVEASYNAEKAKSSTKRKSTPPTPTSPVISDINDETLLQKAREAENGIKFSALYDRGEWQSYFPSASEGVGSLLWQLAFWTKKDKARMDRMFRTSAMYNSEKWDRPQGDSTLGTIEIRKACQLCHEIYDPQKASIQVKNTSCINFPDVTRNGALKATLPNLRTLLDFHGINVFYDEIKKDNCILFSDGSHYSFDNRSEATLAFLTSLLENAGMPVRHLDRYLCEIADRNRSNPVKQWILSVPWDGIDWVGPLCATITAASWFSDDMKTLLIRKWLLSAVAAACHDPRKTPFSTRGVLVFTGIQNIGKTRWFRKLAPQEWVRDGLILDPANKDSVREAITHWICELGELESTFKNDLGRLKAFLTKERDELRLPYAKGISRFPRRVVFAASVNKPDFLIDSTGNNRFWTIPVDAVKYDHNLDMQQVFAQLYEDWRKGKQWWLTDEESAQLAGYNRTFETADEIFDLLTSLFNWENFEHDFNNNCVNWATATDVLMKYCGFKSLPTKAQRNRCASHLRRLTGNREHRKNNARLFPIPRTFFK